MDTSDMSIEKKTLAASSRVRIRHSKRPPGQDRAPIVATPSHNVAQTERRYDHR